MPSPGGSDISLAVFEASLAARNSDATVRVGVRGDPEWIPDGAAANIWKQVSGLNALFGVDLKLGSSVPPVVKAIDVGPNNQSGGNRARNRAITVRDKLGGD